MPRYTTRYKPRTAYWLMRFADEAHDHEAAIKQKHRRKLHCFLAGEYHNVLGRKVADTQGFILVNRHKHSTYMVLSFRGSEMSWKMEGWRTNLSASLATAHWLKAGHEHLKAHHGFIRAYGDVRQEIISAVREVKPLRIYVTGYSLGAALATLAAFHIQTKFPSIHVTMYSFASPYIGDPQFAQVYNLTVPDSHRVVHDDDLVPKLRLLLDTNRRALVECTHVGQEHILPRHPQSKFPHHERIYYLDQLKQEAFH